MLSAESARRAAPDRPPGPRPSVCVVNYNGARYLEASLGALTRLQDSLAEILLVDNASTDGSRDLVESRFPNVRVVAMPENRGAAAARNAGLAAARSDVVILVDNDVTLAPDALDRLLDVFEQDESVVAAMPAITYASDDRTVQYDGADAHFLGQQRLHHEDVPYESLDLHRRDLGSVVSACLVVHRGRLLHAAAGAESLSSFDEDFFIYFEDHDFGYRMRALGLRVLAVPEARCYHDVGTPGLSIRALGSYSPLRVFCHIRNRWLFIAKNYSAWTLVVLSPMLAAYELVQLVAVARKGWLGQWVRALGWLVRHPRVVISKRLDVQRSRRVPDGALLVGGAVPLRAEAVASPVERLAKRLLDAAAHRYWSVCRWLL